MIFKTTRQDLTWSFRMRPVGNLQHKLFLKVSWQIVEDSKQVKNNYKSLSRTIFKTSVSVVALLKNSSSKTCLIVCSLQNKSLGFHNLNLHK